MSPIKGIIAIQVRMAVRQAQTALAGLKGNLTALQTSLGAVNAASVAMGNASLRASKNANTLGSRVKASGIAAMKSASQFQWFSRQLMYNWGIPLIAAGVLATKWSLDVESAMTRVAKVYGSLSMDPDEKKKELAALAKYFEAVSNRYGILQKDVIAIGADWAAAGAEAVGLAKATQLTIETMILGEMSAEEATKSLIAIQEAWRVNAAGLANTIAELNIVENQTAVNMQGLIEAFVRTGSSARIAGLSTGDLAALIAGLVPAAGNATVAGNSLKTILSRIAAPTKAAERAISALGFNIDSTSWRSKNARERLEEMAASFSKMDRNQKQAIATDIAGRQQYNRFVQVMDALADKNSAYWTAQKALLDGKKKINGVTGLQIQYERELNQVLTSNPQAMKMVLARLQNLAIKGFAPLIPYIIAVMQYIVKFTTWLGGLPPEVKKLVAALLLLIVGLTAFSKIIAAFRLLGPAVTILFGTLLRGAESVGFIFGGLGRLIAAPFKILGSLTGVALRGINSMVAGSGKILGRFPLLFAAVFGTVRKGIGASIGAIRAGVMRGLSSLGALVVSGLSKIGPAILVGLRSIGPMIIRLFTGPWGWAIAAVISLVFAFRDQIGAALSGVVNFFTKMWSGVTSQASGIAGFFSKFTQFLVNCFYALPKEIQTAMKAVVDIVYQAAMAVYKLFSYLNPFARHSPSLVENVTLGMEVVAKAFSGITSISRPIDAAYAHIKKFKDLMATFRNGKGVDLEFADDLKNIKAVNPAALSTAKKMIADIKSLQKILDGVSVKMQAQQKITDRWKEALDDANAALEEQQNILDDLGDDVDYYQSIIDDAKNTIDEFASASITGMRDLDDQIQENTQSQNELRLAMAKMEEASGGFDTVADKMAALNGEFEKLTASRDELVKAGAGSDILSYYDEQINAIQSQKNSIYDTADAYTKLSQQLSDLEKKGDILDLTKSVTYDPLTYEIEKLASSQKELSFDEIVNGIKDAQSTVDDFTPALDKATAAYKEQEAVVYALTQQRNLIQRQYDLESAKLDKIKAKYDSLTDTISDLRDALTSISSAANKANGSLAKGKLKTGGVGGGVGGGSGGYPGGGGTGVGKTFGIKDLEKGGVEGINKLTDKMTAAMEALDLTKPIKEKWEQAVKWWNTNIQPAVDLIANSIQDWWNKIDWSPITSNTSWLQDWWKGITEWFKSIGDSLTGVFGEGGIFGKVFGDDFKDAWDNLVQGFKDFQNEVAPGFMDFWESVKPFIDVVGRIIGDTIKSALIILGTVLGTLAKILLWIWNAAIQPLLKGLGRVLGGLFKILGGIMDIFTGIFTLDFHRVADGIWKIFGGLWDALMGLVHAILAVALNLVGGLFKEIWQLFSNFFPEIGKAIEGFWQWLMNIPVIGDFFKWISGLFVWLYDFLVGHSIVPDTVKAIIGWFENMAKWVLTPLKIFIQIFKMAFGAVYDFIVNSPIGKAIQGIVNGIKDGFSKVWEWITSPFKNAEGDVSRSLTDIKNTAQSASDDTEKIFGSSSNWGDLGSTISDPFSTASEKSDDSFDKMFKNFKDFGGDMKKAAKTDWKAIRREINKTLNQLPEDQKAQGKKLADEFEKTAKQIQRTNPALWKKIQESISKPAKQAADDVDKATKQMKGSISGLSGAQIPAHWKNLSRTLSNPVDSAAKNVKEDVRSMNRSIGGLDGDVPREWKNLRTSLVDPVRDAKAALGRIRFSTGNITGPLNRIASAADRVTNALSRMNNKWSQTQNRLGLRYGGSVAADRLNGYANSVGGVSGLATGGSVHGPGGPTSDKVLRYLSSGEHVWTAREVSKLGGQGAVYALRSFIRRNDITTGELIDAYKAYTGRADGGAAILATSFGDSLSASTRRSSSSSVVRQPVGNRSVNIENATFEFPNVKNGKDAKDFLDNLEALIG